MSTVDYGWIPELEKRAGRLNNLLDVYSVLSIVRRHVPLVKHRVDVGKVRDLMRSYSSAKGWVRRFLALSPMVKRRLVTNFGGWQLADAPIRAARYATNLGGPFLGAMSPLQECNLRCEGCYAGGRDQEGQLSHEDCDRLMREGKEIGIHLWTIIGGEPFLRPDLLDLYRDHPDVVFQVYTNGTLFTPELAQTLAEFGNVIPCISLEGYAAETNARRHFYRGRPVYDYVMDTMDMCREAGLLFGGSLTSTRKNYSTLSQVEFWQMLCDKGALLAYVFTMMPVATHEPSVFDELMLSKDQRWQMAEHIWQIRKAFPIFAADFWSDGSLTQGCMAFGRLYFHITHLGDVEPCVFFHFATDNIHEVSLEQALNSPFFRAGRSMFPWTDDLRHPCPVIDHPHVLRELLAEHKAYPTHKEADGITTTLKCRIDQYAAEVPACAAL